MSSRFIVITLVAFAALSGCVLPPVGGAVVRCAVGDVCPDELRCVQGPEGGTCRPTDQACVVDVGGVPTEADNGTACSGGICVAGACVAPVCGDQIISAGETCDGNVDGCRADCTRCGDGVKDEASGEACDEGDDNSDDAAGACRTTCVASSCGDGVIDPDETCDGDDGCRVDCSRCGDGVVDDAAGEICDDGDDNSDTVAGSCRTTCVPAVCGDGVIDPGEACDEGALNGDGAAAACRTNCSRSRCGDGIKGADEACDDGVNNGAGPDACRPTCVTASCGDGIIDTGEVCDFGNANSDVQPNACRRTCVPSSCGDSIRDVEDQCDDGIENSDTVAGACRSTCVLAACGDGVVDPGEDCDDDNQLSGDGCRGDCGKVEACGDGIIDAGETCDDGNTNPRDGCRDCADTTWAIAVAVAGRTSGGATALTSPVGVDVDAVGGVYVADTGGHRVLRLDPSGTVEIIAGTGAAGFFGDDGPAIAAELSGPTDVALSGSGLIFIADHLNDRVRVIDRGVIRTFAGGAVDVANDGDATPLLPATGAQLRRPRALAIDAERLFIAEEEGGRIRVVNLIGAGIGTLVGGGAFTTIPDGPDLKSGRLFRPTDIALRGGTLFIVEAGQQLVRSLDVAVPVDGPITTIAGGGTNPPPRTGTAGSTTVGFEGLTGIAASNTSLFLTDRIRRQVYEVTAAPAPGTGLLVEADPTAAFFFRPAGIAVRDGERFIVDEGRHSCVRIDADGRPDTLVGTGAPGVTNEGALATTVTLVEPRAVAPAAGVHDMLVADAGARRLYAIDAGGHLRTFAGNGDGGAPIQGRADNQPLTPLQVARRSSGSVVVVASVGDLADNVVVEYSPDGATVAVLPVTLPAGFAFETAVADGTPKANADLSRFIAETQLVVRNDRVILGHGPGLFLEEASGAFTTVTLADQVLAMTVDDADDLVILTGSGEVSRVLFNPFELVKIGAADVQVPLLVHHDGRFFSGTQKNGVIDGLTGGLPFMATGLGRGGDGDGGLPHNATVALPTLLVSEGVGRLLIVDRSGRLIRRVTTTGGINTIDTVVGDIHPIGPGTLATATLYAPRTLAVRDAQSLLVGGATGRLLEVRLTGNDVVDGVRVVFGHPAPAATLNEPLARFRPLARDASSFFVVGREATVLDGEAVVRLDTSDGEPSRWTFTVAGTPDAIIAPSAFIAPLGPEILVSDPSVSCVRPFNPTTGTVGAAVFGVCGTAGSFAGLVRSPGPVTVTESGTIYLADTGNHRVLRRDGATGVVSVVIGDGSPSSAGQGGPAGTFPVNAPGQLAVDSAGNLFIASSTTVRLVANIDGDADADANDDVSTIYGIGNRDAFPESESRCIAALALDEPRNRLFVADACAGFIVQLDLVDLL